MVYFNVRRVILMAAAAKQQQQQQQQLTSDSIPAIRIWTWAKTQLEKVEDLYKKRKSEIIKEVAERLELKGFPVNKICMEIVKQLSDYVDDKYVYEVLPSKYKDTKYSHSMTNRSENRAKEAVQQIIAAEAYDIDKIETYSKPYLIEIVKYLHETLQLACENTNKRMEEELKS